MLREATAREEAAHAVAACRAGRRIVSVSLSPACCKLADQRDYSLADAVTRIVGPMAIGAWPPAPSPALPVIFDDGSAAELICDLIATENEMNAKALLAAAEDRAAALLRDPRFIADVDQLSQRLLIDGQISGCDIAPLLGTNEAAPWRAEPAPPAPAPWREAVC